EVDDPLAVILPGDMGFEPRPEKCCGHFFSFSMRRTDRCGTELGYLRRFLCVTPIRTQRVEAPFVLERAPSVLQCAVAHLARIESQLAQRKTLDECSIRE